MPELPEVETVRRGLAELVDGATVTSAHVFRQSCTRLQPGSSAQFTSLLTGATLRSAVRRGKFLWWLLDEQGAAADAAPFAALSAHLGMSGQFRVFDGPEPVPHAHCRARLTLEKQGEQLFLDFLDQRTFGYLVVEELVPTPDGGPGGLGSDLPALPSTVAHIGRDALDAIGAAEHSRMWRVGSRGIKQVMLDQTKVSGIGNIYADEALWLARVHPLTPARELSARAAGRLASAAREVMNASLAQGGTSFDALYVNVNGESGYFARDLNAYARAGEPCKRCDTPIKRHIVHGRATHWCPRCQRIATRRSPF